MEGHHKGGNGGHPDRSIDDDDDDDETKPPSNFSVGYCLFGWITKRQKKIKFNQITKHTKLTL
ncbi:hypothetical protein DERF_003634 [Dermatophagoides farinae]|uniref:Uncharacterized protein n=1 Tax=Dermatophagoides farinae TaxID=6954 RepID=A0A922LCM6_DERFA|nr:hypothetical protein DERF_003634 [Dermatophagoides farinae]